MKSITPFAVVALLASSSVVAEERAVTRDAALERFLGEGAVVSKEEIGSGVTRPWRVELERDGRRITAAFKTVSIRKPGLTEFPDGKKEMDFTDDYRYEYAAYLLDRRLGLGMVPVAALRVIDGEPGVVIEWIDDALSEAKRMQRDQVMPEYLRRQRSTMSMFDALIANVDRHAANQLVTPDGRLHLIDHSRSFRTNRKLPDAFARTPAGVTADVLRNLASLDRDGLRELLGEVLSRAQINAVLRRRDRILEKIEADLAEYGEQVVLWDPAAFAARLDVDGAGAGEGVAGAAHRAR